MTPEHVEERARQIQDTINKRVKEESKNWSYLEYEARTEMVVEEILGKDSPWEYDIMQAIGVPPMVIITKYAPRKAK